MLGLGLDLALKSSRGGAAFNPLALNPAAWYDPSDLTSMFQDSAGTVPAVVNSPVGRINDKSGNARHATQAVAAARPTLRLASGKYYLEFDGVDDLLVAAFTINQPWDRVAGINQISWTANDYLFCGAAGNTGALGQFGASPTLQLYDGSALGCSNNGAAVGATAVSTERHDGANSRLAINNGAYATGSTGVQEAGGVVLGAHFQVQQWAHMRLYGMIMVPRAMSDAETAEARSYMANKAGVTL